MRFIVSAASINHRHTKQIYNYMTAITKYNIIWPRCRNAQHPIISRGVNRTTRSHYFPGGVHHWSSGRHPFRPKNIIPFRPEMCLWEFTSNFFFQLEAYRIKCQQLVSQKNVSFIFFLNQQYKKKSFHGFVLLKPWKSTNNWTVVDHRPKQDHGIGQPQHLRHRWHLDLIVGNGGRRGRINRNLLTHLK